MKRTIRFFAALSQIVGVLVLVGGIVFSVYRIWQEISAQTYSLIWVYGLLFMICAYALGFMMKRHDFDLTTAPDEGVISLLFIAGFITGGFVYVGVNTVVKRLYWVIFPDKRPPPELNKNLVKRGEIIPFRDNDS